MKKPIFFPELLLLFITVLITALLTRNINLFGDDFITIEQIRNYNMGDLIKSLWYDNHPPFFYIILKLYSNHFGTSILALKSFNIVCYFALIGAIYYLGHNIGGLKLARTAAFSLVLLPSLLNNPILFIRSYLLSSLLALLMAAYAYFVYTRPCKKNSTIFVIISICACFTHYYVTFFTGLIHLILYICLLIQSKNHWKKCLKFSIPCLVLLVPCTPIFIHQILLKHDNIDDTTSLIPRIAESIIYPFYTGTHLPVKNYVAYITSVALLLVFVYIIIKFLREYKKTNLVKHEINAIFISLFLPLSIMIFLIIEGYINKPVWFGNYINLYIPIIILGFSWMLCSLKNKRLFYLWFPIVSICFMQKLYLQAAMCRDDGYLRYENLYTNGVITSSDIIIKANQNTSAYFPNVQQFNDGVLPDNWYRYIYDHVSLVNNFDSIVEDKTRFFTGYELDSVKYDYIFNKGFRLEKQFDFDMKYFDYTRTSLFLYSREITDIR